MGKRTRAQQRFNEEQVARGNAINRNVPDPMPARTADGTQVWIHWSPIRVERHP